MEGEGTNTSLLTPNPSSILSRVPLPMEKKVPVLPIFLLLGFVPLPVPQHQLLPRGTKYLLESCQECLQTVEVVEGGVLAVLEALTERKNPYLLDPYVKDSRCQTQACFVFAALNHLERAFPKTAYDTWKQKIETGNSELRIWLNNFRRQILGQKSDRYAAEYTAFIEKQFNLPQLLWADEKSPPQGEVGQKLVYAFRTLILYFFLGSTRGQNWFSNQPLCEKIKKYYVSKKSIGPTLLRIAKCQTREFQTIMTQMFNIESNLLTKDSEYFFSILVFYNFLVQSRAPVVLFTQYNCLQCKAKQSIKLEVVYEDHAQEVRSLSDLRYVGTGSPWLSLHPEQERKYPIQTLSQVIEALSILPSCLISEIASYVSDTYSVTICGVTEQPNSESLPCRGGNCLSRWYQRVQTVGLESILLSYGFFHEKTRPEMNSFHPFQGTSKEDSSVYHVKHILCSQSTASEPSWRRVDA